MVSVGDAKDLLALGVQIVSFINDMRYAQDSFNALRAEAQCLHICINSLSSGPCQDAFHRYMSAQQRQDMHTIIQNTKLNMKDLNEFLTDCKALVKKDAKKIAKRKSLSEKWKNYMKHAWAAFQFTLTDPQPFRDKLALPTASINVFLTSMTHVGLMNVGSLLSLSSPGVVIPGTSAIDAVSSWDLVGHKVAFKRKAIPGLTADMEDEILRYANHLAGGGNVFDEKVDDLAMVRSSSKDKSNGQYMVRRKTVVYPGSHTKNTYESVRLDVPQTPSSPSSPRIIEAEPSFVQRRQSHSRSQSADIRTPGSPNRRFVELNQQKEKRQEKSDQDLAAFRERVIREVEEEMKASERQAEANLASRSSNMRTNRRASRPNHHSYMDYESRLKPERMHSGGRPDDENIPHILPEDDSDSDSEDDIIDILNNDYGLVVERVFDNREPVDNGTVDVTIPSTLMGEDEAPAPVSEVKPPQPARCSRLKQETSYAGPRRSTYRQSSRFEPYGHNRYEGGSDYSGRGSREFRVSDNSRRKEYERHRPRESNPEIFIYSHDGEGEEQLRRKATTGDKIVHLTSLKDSQLRGSELRRSTSDRGPQPSITKTSDGYAVRRKKRET